MHALKSGSEYVSRPSTSARMSWPLVRPGVTNEPRPTRGSKTVSTPVVDVCDGGPPAAIDL